MEEAMRATTVVTLKLVSKGAPYWERPDLGIGQEDVKVQGRQVQVTVHSLGSVDAPATTVALVDMSGKVLASVPVPALKAPLDLFPKTTTVTLTVPKGASIKGCSVVVDPDATLREITRMNNRVSL
jgi:CARDB